MASMVMMITKRRRITIIVMQISSVELSWQSRSLSCARIYIITKTTQIHLERLHDIEIIFIVTRFFEVINLINQTYRV